MAEQWKMIPDCDDAYEVSNAGNVRRVVASQGTKAGPLKAVANKAGYMTVSLRVAGQTKTRYIHELVGRAFVKGYKKGLAVNHKNRKRSDNAASNLEFLNAEDNKGHGRITTKGVAMIKKLATKEGRSPEKIAKMLNLRVGTVKAVLRND